MEHRARPIPTLFGVAVPPLTMAETVEACCGLVASGRGGQHVSLNAGKVVLMQDDPILAEIVRQASLVSADGMSVVWAARLLGHALPERIAGIDLMERLLGEAAARRWPVYFLGATEQVLGSFGSVVRARHPGLRIAGARNGYFTDDRAVAREIGLSGARLLFVAMPSPRKEHFVAAGHELMPAVLAVGVGGSFDVWAGLRRRAPAWMQSAGVEWLFRLVQEPRRMWRRYLVGNTRFLALVAREALRRRGYASARPREGTTAPPGGQHSSRPEETGSPDAGT